MNTEIKHEFRIKATRSSGKGGQHLNKVSTKVQVYFHISESIYLTIEEKEQLKKQLEYRINKAGYLRVVCDTYRTQLKNKEEAIAKLINLIEKNIVPKRERKKTKKTQASNLKRLQSKKNLSIKKNLRAKPDSNS